MSGPDLGLGCELVETGGCDRSAEGADGVLPQGVDGHQHDLQGRLVPRDVVLDELADTRLPQQQPAALREPCLDTDHHPARVKLGQVDAAAPPRAGSIQRLVQA